MFEMWTLSLASTWDQRFNSKYDGMGVTCKHCREVGALVATQEMLGLVAKVMIIT